MASKIVGEAARILGNVDNEGIWGPVTATLDWCEANYQFSHYVAEMANSFSNALSVWLALQGFNQAAAFNFPSRYLFYWAGFALVGLGSFAFHATLLYGPQLADELPMIYVASWSCFLLYDTQPGFCIQNKRSKRLLYAMVTFDVLFTASYLAYRNPVYHQVVFGSVMFNTVGRSTYLLHGSPKYSSKVPENTKKSIIRVFWIGSVVFSLGFVVWNIDNVFCSNLTMWKRKIGWPVAFLLEGHSWWHVLTGTGTYFVMEGVVFLTLCLKDDHKKYDLQYTRLGLPYVSRARAGAASRDAK